MTAQAQTLALLRGLQPRIVAYVTAALALGIFVGGWIQGSGWTMSFDADLGWPVVYTGVLAMMAAGLLWFTSRGGSLGEADARNFRMLALILLLVGAEQALSLHERLDEGFSTAILAAPILALLLLALMFALRLPAGVERNGLLLGLGLWTVVEIFDIAEKGESVVASALVLIAAPVLLVSALAVVQRFRDDPGVPETEPSLALRALLMRVNPMTAGFVILGLVVAMLFFATLYHDEVIPLNTFDLRSQQGLNTFYSEILMLIAGGLSLLRGRLTREDPWYSWTLLGVIFWVMVVIDIFAFHEEIGHATGVKGQYILMPVIIAAGIGWLYALMLSGTWGRRLWLGGAVFWVVSQAIDVSTPEGYFHWSVLPEESFELFGSTLFVVALLLAVQATAGGYRRLAVGDFAPAREEPEAVVATGGV